LINYQYMSKDFIEIKKKVYLSELLYEVGEIKSTLLNCVIEESSDDEIIFWVHEIWNAGFKNIWNFIWKIFYDFYCFCNQDKINIFMKLNAQYNDLNGKKDDNEDYELIQMKILCGVFMILKRLDKNCIIFLLRNNTFNKNVLFTDLSRFKNIYKSYDCSTNLEKLFVCAMDNKLRSIKIGDCLYSIKISNNILKNLIKLYEKKYNKKFIKNKYYVNDKHLLLLYIVVNRNKFYRIENQIYKTILMDEDTHKINTLVSCLRKPLNVSAYKYLSYKRLYTINPVPGIVTALIEKPEQQKLQLLRENWMLYIYKTPIWKKRIQTFKHRLIKKNGFYKIFFNTIEDEINFYNDYGYDPNELSLGVQMKSISNYKSNIRDWIFKHFQIEKWFFNIKCMFNEIRY
jgi:hypothetical protein